MNMSLPMIVRKAPTARTKPPKRRVLAIPPLIKFSDPNAFKLNPTKATIERIVETVAVQHGIRPVDIMDSRKRIRHLVWARQDAMLAIKLQVDISLGKLAQLWHMDHTTVIYGLKRAENRYWIAHAMRRALDNNLPCELKDWDAHPAEPTSGPWTIYTPRKILNAKDAARRNP